MDLTTHNKTILIVEDEQKLAQLMREYLEQAGYSTASLYDGRSVLLWLAENSADLIILDVMLPGIDGISLCQKIRDDLAIPIIMASAKISESDRLSGLNNGADDYICKPYSMRELVARVNAMFRRYKIISEQSLISSTPKEIGPFTLNQQKQSLSLNTQHLPLTVVEFRLLSHLLKHPEVPFTRDELLNQIYDDYRFVTDRTIDTHIKNIRRKIQQADIETEIIHSVYGVGYKLALPPKGT